MLSLRPNKLCVATHIGGNFNKHWYSKVLEEDIKHSIKITQQIEKGQVMQCLSNDYLEKSKVFNEICIP